MNELKAGSLIDNYHSVDVRDLTGHLGDYLHYNATSQEEIGMRMARAYFNMICRVDRKVPPVFRSDD